MDAETTDVAVSADSGVAAARATSAAAAEAPPGRRDPVTAVFFGWLVPGFGHVIVGRPWKGLYYLTLIAAVFGGGLALSHGWCVNPEREPIWFVGQAFAGAPAAVVAWLTRGLEPTERVATFDVGLLYTAVAGLLNLVAISDVLGIVDVRNRARDAWERARARDATNAKDAREATRSRATATEGTPDATRGASLDGVAIPPASDVSDPVSTPDAAGSSGPHGVPRAHVWPAIDPAVAPWDAPTSPSAPETPETPS